MMETALEQAAATSRPILVNANPATWEDAVANQAAFSDEARLNRPPSPSPSSSPPAEQDPGPGPTLRQLTKIPRMKKCHGWLTLQTNVFKGYPWYIMPPVMTVSKIRRFFSHGKDYMAIVYEYVEEAENDLDTMQQAMDFFWLAGFSRTLSPLLKNWKSGVLVDLSDIVPPRGYLWKHDLYRKGPASASLMLQRAELEKNVFTGLKPPADEVARLQTQRRPACRGRPTSYAGITKTRGQEKRTLGPSQMLGEEMLTETTPCTRTETSQIKTDT